MQSVALEAMEQFGKNSLALTDRSVPLTHTQTFCKTDDGSLVPADSPERPDTCDAREKTVGSRWSLLLDGSNTEANLNGTSELASLDYNVFSTIYGLQYAFSPEWSAGAAFGYGQTNLYNYEYANAHINADTYGGSIWGIYRPSADWKISGLLGYMNLQYDSTRQMAFGSLNRTANANWDGNGFTTALEAQYNWALNGDSNDPDAIRLKPKTFLAYAVHNQGLLLRIRRPIPQPRHRLPHCRFRSLGTWLHARNTDSALLQQPHHSAVHGRLRARLHGQCR